MCKPYTNPETVSLFRYVVLNYYTFVRSSRIIGSFVAQFKYIYIYYLFIIIFFFFFGGGGVLHVSHKGHSSLYLLNSDLQLRATYFYNLHTSMFRQP